MAVPPTSLLIKETLNSDEVISSLQRLKKDDWLAIKAYIYIMSIYLTRIKLFN